MLLSSAGDCNWVENWGSYKSLWVAQRLVRVQRLQFAMAWCREHKASAVHSEQFGFEKCNRHGRSLMQLSQCLLQIPKATHSEQGTFLFLLPLGLPGFRRGVGDGLVGSTWGSAGGKSTEGSGAGAGVEKSSKGGTGGTVTRLPVPEGLWGSLASGGSSGCSVGIVKGNSSSSSK